MHAGNRNYLVYPNLHVQKAAIERTFSEQECEDRLSQQGFAGSCNCWVHKTLRALRALKCSGLLSRCAETGAKTGAAAGLAAEAAAAVDKPERRRSALAMRAQMTAGHPDRRLGPLLRRRALL